MLVFFLSFCEKFLLVRTPCPRYFEALYEVLNSPEIKQELQAYEYLFYELTRLTGMNLTESEDVQSLYLTLLAEVSFKRIETNISRILKIYPIWFDY